MSVNKTLKDWINLDKKYTYTPDLPSLRYFGGAIPVFLWDGMQDYMTLKENLRHLTHPNSFEIRYPKAVTCRKFVPWYNMKLSTQHFASYCLEEPEDIDFLSVPEYTKGEPKALKGKVVYVTLEILCELDGYFENENLFNRVKVDVYPSTLNKNAIKVFTWMNDVDQLSEFNLTTNEYEISDGIDPVLFREDDDGTYAY